MRKLLFAASNPNKLPDLRIAAEISALTDRFMRSSTDRLDVIHLPDLDAIGLESALRQHQPDILHLVAHGHDENKLLVRKSGSQDWSSLDAATLNAWLPRQPPRLVYVNACDSDAFADDLVGLGKVKLAIGTTAPIENAAARAASVTFYSRLASGSTVREAYDACNKMASFEQGNVGMHLASAPGADTEQILHQPPFLIACFMSDPPERRKNGVDAFRIGLGGCPPYTSQLIFFTDDDRYATDRGKLESLMSSLLRGSPTRGEMWMQDNMGAAWFARQDVRIFVAGTNPAGEAFIVAPTDLSEALARYYLMTNGGVVPDVIDAAIRKLMQPHRFQTLFREGPLRRERELDDAGDAPAVNKVPSPAPPEDAIEFHTQDGWDFRHTAETLASGAVVTFRGFSARQLKAEVQARHIRCGSVPRALELIGKIVRDDDFPEYTVTVNDGEIILRRTGA